MKIFTVLMLALTTMPWTGFCTAINTTTCQTSEQYNTCLDTNFTEDHVFNNDAFTCTKGQTRKDCFIKQNWKNCKQFNDFIELACRQFGPSKVDAILQGRQSSTSSVQTNEQNTTKTDNSKDVIKEIKAQNNVTLGSSISIPNTLLENDGVDTAHSEWEQKCTNLSNTEYSTDIEKKENNNITSFTCIIQTCKKAGFKVSTNKKSCEKTSEQKKQEKEQTKTKEQMFAVINKLKIGDSVSYNTSESKDMQDILTKFNSACNAATGEHIENTIVDIKKQNDQTILTCIVSDCDDEKYEVSEDKKSCIQYVSAEQKAATSGFKNQIMTIKDAFHKRVEELIKECENKKGTISENGECVEPEQKDKNNENK